MMTYEIVTITAGIKTVTNIKKVDGDTIYMIPLDPDNSDYQAYLAWVAEGNVAQLVEIPAE